MEHQHTDAVPVADERTVMSASINPVRSLCELHIASYGDDVVQALKHELRRIRREEVQVVEMFLNLTDPCTPWVVAEAENIGFFFTGILPETLGGDSIILQYFNGVQVEYDAIQIDRPQTAELLAYVKSHDPTMV
jgi:serine/threonine-protein kinase RsbW